ncbi:MAG: helix-turn-helix transcriptional regulator [Clostridia bacterium]|nr:helix-turn-helix transcriptional regulator [Clostridia bacterium]
MVRIHMCGLTKNTAAWQQKRRLVTHTYFWYVIGGNAKYKSDTEEVTIVPGHLYVTPCNTVFEIVQDPNDMIDHMWYVAYGVHDLPRHVLDIDIEKAPLIKAVVVALIRLTCAKNVSQSTRAQQLDVLISLLPREKNISKEVEQIINYINGNINEKFNIHSLSKRFGYERSYIGRLFKKHVNIPLNEYIFTVRMEKACALLMENEKVGAVAKSVGYSDVKAFSRAFRRFMRMSPMDYKNSQAEASSV